MRSPNQIGNLISNYILIALSKSKGMAVAISALAHISELRNIRAEKLTTDWEPSRWWYGNVPLVSWFLSKPPYWTKYTLYFTCTWTEGRGLSDNWYRSLQPPWFPFFPCLYASRTKTDLMSKHPNPNPPRLLCTAPWPLHENSDFGQFTKPDQLHWTSGLTCPDSSIGFQNAI